MVDYSWIKPGVKAIVVGCISKPELNGEIVTVASEIRIGISSLTGQSVECVSIAEDILPRNWSGLTCRILKPYKPDEDDTPDWNDIANPYNKSKCVDYSHPITEEV